MAFDGIFSALLINEIKPIITNCRIDKIYQPTRDSFVFGLRKPDFQGLFLVSASPNGARFQLTKNKLENPEKPPMMCMLFRKKLVGGIITEISQEKLERVCTITIKGTNDLGDETEYHLIAEIMGRNSNILLLNQDNRIIDCVKKTDATNTVRILMPGAVYEAPPLQQKSDLLDINQIDIEKTISQFDKLPLSKALQSAFTGLSPVVCREIDNTLATNDKTYDELSAEKKDKLKQLLIEVGQIKANTYFCPTLITDEKGKGIEFSYIDLKQYGANFNNTKYPTLCELLDEFYKQMEKSAVIGEKKTKLLKTVKRLLARTKRKINYQIKELADTENCEQKRIFGELIKANIHLIKPGDEQCELINFYSENLEPINVPLDKTKSASANAQKYFKDYRKACNAKQLLGDLIKKSRLEAEYLESVLFEIEQAETRSEINDIEEELINEGYLRSSSKFRKKTKKDNNDGYLSFVSKSGFTVLVGKNNRQNEFLTFKVANKNDIWLHIKNYAGSHVIIKTNGVETDDNTLEFAASLAATHSSVGDGKATVSIDYCPVKYVKKIPGGAIGMVTYSNFSTIVAKPQI